MSIIRDITLYLNAGITTPEIVHVNQYDQGEVWRFTLLESDGSQYTPSSGALIGVKADGHAIAGVTGTVLGDGRVQITETQQMTAAAGDAIFELTIDGLTHGTANFTVRVEKKPTDGAILSGSDLSIIQEGLNSVTPAVIEEKVSEWLEENFTEPPVDQSLTIANAAADAKVTGDKITELKTEITTLDDAIFPNNDVVIRTVSASLPNNNDYWGLSTLIKNHRYRIVLSFSADPIRLSALKTSTTASGGGVVDTITSLFTGDSWVEGKTCIYTPQVDDIKYLQIQMNSAYTGDLSATLTVYDYDKEEESVVVGLEAEINGKQAEIDGLKYVINLDNAYNLLPPDGYEVGKYISTSGVIGSDGVSVLSDYVEIDPSQEYICNWAKTASVVYENSALTGNVNTFDRLHFCFFDKDKNVVPFTDSTSTPSKAIPSTAKYIRVTILNESVYPLARLIYGNYSSQPIVRPVQYQKTQQKTTDSPNTGFEGFKMVMFGDSITHGSLSSDESLSYVDYANDVLHSKIVNVGFGGTRMTYPTLTGAYLFCFYHLCECIVSEDESIWDDLITYATNENPTYMTHLQALMNMDWSTVKAVGLMYGANDYTSNTPVGSEYNENTVNFDGACAYGLKLLLTKYPHLQVIILTPFDREMTVGDPSSMTDVMANSAGLYMSDYADALKNVQSRIHCPLIKTGELFGINQYTILTYAPDGTHPRANIAQKRLGWLFAQAVKNNITPF